PAMRCIWRALAVMDEVLEIVLVRTFRLVCRRPRSALALVLLTALGLGGLRVLQVRLAITTVSGYLSQEFWDQLVPPSKEASRADQALEHLLAQFREADQVIAGMHHGPDTASLW